MKKSGACFEYPVYDSIRDIILSASAQYPRHTMFIIKKKTDGEVRYRKIDYTEFISELYAYGTGLYARGLAGKKIGIISPNRYEWCLTYAACYMGGMISVPIDKGLPRDELLLSIERTGVDAIVFSKDYADLMNEIKAKEEAFSKVFICMDDNDAGFETVADVLADGRARFEAGERAFKNAKVDPHATATLVLTSGTSARSKIVMLSQFNIARNMCDMHRVELFLDSDVNLALVPLHHTLGSTAYLIMLSKGITTVFPDGLRYIAENMKEYGVTFFVGVPALVEAIYKRVNKEIARQGKTKQVAMAKVLAAGLEKVGVDVRRKLFKDVIDALGGLRFIICGAAPLDPKVEKAMNAFGVLTLQGYGMTEASPVIAAEGYKSRRLGSIGLAMPSIDTMIADPDENGVGELVVRGPNIMSGYYNDEEKTAETLVGGWLHTGDLARMDKDGYIFLCGRKKDMIVLKNGKKIFPDEIEAMIGRLDIVSECMVFGKPEEGTDDLSLAVKVKYDMSAVKEAFGTPDEEALNAAMWEKIKEINRTLPAYKAIKHLYIEKGDFIKTTTNKIKRAEEMKKIANETPFDHLAYDAKKA